MKKLTLLLIVLIFSSGCLFSQSNIENRYDGKILEFESTILKEKKRVFVHLPDNYKTKSYPTIYLISSSPRDFRAAIFQGQFIEIGIENVDPKKYFIGQSNRDNYLQFLESELIPFVEKEYNASSVKFISGHSISGGFVIDIFAKHPCLFSFYIATSPAIQVLNLNITKTAFDKPAYLYFDIGSRENYEQLEKANNDLAKVLDSLKIENLRWKYEVLADETHETNEYTGFCRGYNFYKSFSTIPDSLLSKNIQTIVDYVNNLNSQLGSKVEIGEYVFMPNLLINLEAGNHKNVLSVIEYIAKENPDFIVNESKLMVDIADEILNKGHQAIAKQAYQIIFDKTKDERIKEKIDALSTKK